MAIAARHGVRAIARLARRLAQGLTLSLILFAGAASAQSGGEAGIPGWQHRRWTHADGAPGFIFAIAQTPDGFLWIGAATGLYRFDGIRFEKMPPVRAAFAKSATVRALLVAANGDLIVGHDFGGVSRISKRRHASVGQRVDGSTILNLAERSDGGLFTLLHGSIKHNSWLLRDGRWQFVDLLPGDAGFPRQVLVDRDDTIWLLGSDRLFAVPRSAGASTTHALPMEAGTTLARHPDGSVLLVRRGDVRRLRFDRAAGRMEVAETVIRLPSPARDQHLLFERGGGFWAIDPQAGITRLAMARGGVRALGRFAASRGELAYSRSFLIDREGNLWAATAAGLDQFRPSALSAQAPVADASMVAIGAYDVARDRSGDLLVREGGRLSRVTASGDLERLGGRLPEDSPLCPTARSGTWALDRGAFRRWGPREPAAWSVPGHTGSDISACLEDGDGRLWFSSGTNRLMVRTAAGIETLRYPDYTVNQLGFDARGHVLAYIGNGALWHRDGAQFRVLWRDPAATLGFIEFIYTDGRNTYFGGPNGLARYDGKRIRMISSDRFPVLSFLNGMVNTGRGETWLHGDAGLLRLSTADLDRSFDDRHHVPAIAQLGLRDGLPGTPQYHSRSSLAEDRWGRVWIATANGVAVLDPARLGRNATPPPVTLLGLEAAGRRYDLLDPVVLRPHTSQIRIEFTALSLTRPEDNRFRYRLSGIDADWVDAGSVRRADYANLGPGDYRFEVLAANNDGVWSKRPARLAFRIEPAFTQTWWFLGLCLLAVAILLIIAFRLRAHRLARRLAADFELRLMERERIARELHDNLLQSVQGLVLRFHAVARRLSPDDPAHAPLESAMERADGVLAEARQRVMDLRDEDASTDLLDALDRVQGVAGPTPAGGVRRIVRGQPRPVHPEAVTELVAIATEALTNVARHAAAETAEIELAYDRRRLRMTIRDDGVGMPQAVLEQGRRKGHFGLVGIGERAARLNGRFTIARRETGGTELTVSVPARSAYAVARRP